MNYFEILTMEEKSTICRIITGRGFRTFFKGHEDVFSKIRKGFRAKWLSEEQALAIGIANVDKPPIASWVNKMLGSWIKQINDNIEKHISDGSTPDIALAEAMIDSVFDSNVDLYLKLTGAEMDEGNRSRLLENMEIIKSERAINTEVDRRTKAIEEENQRLITQIEAVQQQADFNRLEYERKIQELEQEKEALQISLADAQGKIAELNAIPPDVREGNADHLAQFDDTDLSVLPSAGSEETVSLCGVITDYYGKKWLIRYADLSCDGLYNLFRKSEDAPPYFSNRDKIFYKDGPSDDGFCGAWSWTAIPSERDSSKDYITSQYNMRLDAIEVVTPSEDIISDIDGLIGMLKSGIEYQLHSRKVMFSFYSSKGQYTGILCKAKELNMVNGRIAISENCVEMPVYEFKANDILRLDNGLLFYRRVFAGPPTKIYQLKSTLEIVRDIVLSSISWSTYKARTVTRAEYRTFKNFLGAIPLDDIMHRVEIACHCTNSAAKALLDEFLATVWQYIDGNSLDDAVILSAINANMELQERAKSLILADWEAEHRDQLAEAQQKLASADAALKATTIQLTEANEALEKAKLEEKSLTNIIAEKEKLAEDVEKKVEERIKEARKNAADFIANMAFWDSQPAQAVETNHHATSVISTEAANTQYSVISLPGDLNDLEHHHTWADVMNTAAFELEEAGVTERYSSGLAAFLCAAYIEKQPLLLVGPNAIDISQAFSATIGRKYGQLCCERNYDNKIIAGIGVNDEKVVIINNLISSGWINRLPEILSHKDVFYIVTHPYAEDIQVEPKSLYGFILPLFTEVFVDKCASGKYLGGFFSDDFTDYKAPKEARIELRLVSKLALSPLIKKRIKNLIAVMHCIYTSATADEDFLFAEFPIAYASLAINDLAEAINGSQKSIDITSSLKRQLQYILGEA